MLKINGQHQNTVADAASYFGVSVKTVKEWIKKKIISEPPKMVYGLREIEIFPKDFLEKAKDDIKKYRKEKKRR